MQPLPRSARPATWQKLRRSARTGCTARVARSAASEAGVPVRLVALAISTTAPEGTPVPAHPPSAKAVIDLRPWARSKTTTASRPLAAARIRAVSPFILTRSRRAPASRRTLAASAWPPMAARCSGVLAPAVPPLTGERHIRLRMRMHQVPLQPPALVIEIAAALVASIATRSPGRRAAAKSRIAGLTQKLLMAPSGVLTVATPVDAS